jgi:uncharacterized protein (TIGR03435 family)
VPLQGIISIAYQKDPQHTVTECELPAGKFDFIAKLAEPHQPYNPADEKWAGEFQKVIARQFGVTGRFEMREADVLVLKPVGEETNNFKLSHIMPNGVAIRPKPGSYEFFRQPLSTLVHPLEGRFKLPVVDKTGLKEKYDYAVRWDETDRQHPNNEGLKQALRNQLGLELVPSREPIEMLVVEKVK